MDTAQLKKVYKETIAPELQKQFNYSSAMQVPVLKKIVINQGLGDATQDKKIVDVAVNEITAITGQKAVATYSKFFCWMNRLQPWIQNWLEKLKNPLPMQQNQDKPWYWSAMICLL